MVASLLEKMWFLVASWASALHFQDMAIPTILRSWQEVAFSLILRPECLSRWFQPPSGLSKLNFDGSVIGNMSTVYCWNYSRQFRRGYPFLLRDKHLHN